MNDLLLRFFTLKHSNANSVLGASTRNNAVWVVWRCRSDVPASDGHRDGRAPPPSSSRVFRLHNPVSLSLLAVDWRTFRTSDYSRYYNKSLTSWAQVNTRAMFVIRRGCYGIISADGIGADPACRRLCALDKRERNYCVTRKEFLAVVHFMNYLKQSLFGRHFKVLTISKFVTSRPVWPAV